MSSKLPEFVEIKPSNVVKTRKYTLLDRKHHCQQWQQSGLSMSEYCQQSGLSISTFSQWVIKFKKPPASSKEIEPHIPNTALEGIEITLVSGVRLRFDRSIAVSEIVRLVRALQLCN